MSTAPRFVAAAWLLGAIGAASAAAEPAAGSESCESAVAQTVRDMRGGSPSVQVGSARPVLPQPAGARHTLAGTGHYASRTGSARSFSYTCSVDAETGKTSGVVFKESGADRTEAAAPAEPDLSRLSPEACEAAAAAALTEQYPPIGRIRFDSGSRSLSAAPAARTRLEGRGSLERVAGMNAAPFTYRCMFEAASGKIVSVQTED